MVMNASGRVINPSFIDYKMIRPKDMPKLTTILVETEEPLGPYGAKSISEIRIDAPAQAVANAYSMPSVSLPKAAHPAGRCA